MSLTHPPLEYSIGPRSPSKHRAEVSARHRQSLAGPSQDLHTSAQDANVALLSLEFKPGSASTPSKIWSSNSGRKKSLFALILVREIGRTSEEDFQHLPDILCVLKRVERLNSVEGRVEDVFPVVCQLSVSASRQARLSPRTATIGPGLDIIKSSPHSVASPRNTTQKRLTLISPHGIKW